MAFALTTSDFALQEDTILVARVRKGKDIWVYSRINLNEHIGSHNGEFHVASSGWFGWSRPGSSHLQGTVLFAQLMKPDGSWGPSTSIDLNLFIKNDNGTLKFQKLCESITASASCFNLTGSILQGLCLGYDGKLHYSEINLDDYYGNIEGRIEPGSSYLFKTGDGFQVCPSSSEVRLRGHLRCHPRWRPKSRRRESHVTWNYHDIDLSHSIINKNGQFGFIRRAGALNKPYQLAVPSSEEVLRKISIPGTVDLIPGNEEQVANTIAECTNSSIAAIGLLVGAALETIVGNHAIGLAIGSGLAAPGGILPEIESLTTCISDPLVLTRSLEASISRYVYRMLRNILSPGAVAYLVAFVNAKYDPNVDESVNEVLDCLGATNISGGAAISLETAIIRAMDALSRQKISEWSDLDLALEMIRAQQSDCFNDFSAF
ncbi:hypothetical protein TWF730_002581 [Orbilia blumenaviensis]|uniref:Cyanovirin-N domain-containing protein n=1 Tax=Orbilia blumenaviensis TaxID=1796055 RepID=A0AAV9UB25_9PEZI